MDKPESLEATVPVEPEQETPRNDRHTEKIQFLTRAGAWLENKISESPFHAYTDLGGGGKLELLGNVVQNTSSDLFAQKYEDITSHPAFTDIMKRFASLCAHQAEIHVGKGNFMYALRFLAVGYVVFQHTEVPMHPKDFARYCAVMYVLGRGAVFDGSYKKFFAIAKQTFPPAVTEEISQDREQWINMSVPQLVKRMLAARDKKDWAQVRDMAQEIINRQPNDLHACVWLAIACDNLNMFEDALRVRREFIRRLERDEKMCKKNEDQITRLMLMAKCAAYEDGAFAGWNFAALTPNDIQNCWDFHILVEFVQAARKERDFSCAEMLQRRLLEIQPDAAESHLSLISILYELGPERYQDALSVSEAALEKFPNFDLLKRWVKKLRLLVKP